MARLLEPLTAATTAYWAVPDRGPVASGFLTIGRTTYVDPAGSYPIDHHRADGSATVIINDTNRHVVIVTESDRGGRAGGRGGGRGGGAGAGSGAGAGIGRQAAVDKGAEAWGVDGDADVVLAPGERVETWRGSCVQVN
ncbi:hypothetical protein QOM21_24165 [Streptomyces sp. Pv4-95]|uniref:hypothetical protein n=1 Tax=Streptomyces sp. Pv4-95 TaxID=3049543 RepID=UPI003891F60B